MESTKKKAGRPKSEPRTGPLVLEGGQKRETILTEVSADTAQELSAYAVWVRESASAKLTPAEAMSKTIDFALRDVFARDKCWQEHKRTGGRTVGTTETETPPLLRHRPRRRLLRSPGRQPRQPLSHRQMGVTVGSGRRRAAENIHHLGLDVALEHLLRRFIRDALHVEPRAMGVPDAPLSGGSDPSCVRNGSILGARAVRYCGFESAAAIRGCSERRDRELAPHIADSRRSL